jgi:hypothetical protein
VGPVQADAAAGKAVIGRSTRPASRERRVHIDEGLCRWRTCRCISARTAGEASGTIKTPGPDIHVVLRGTLDLSGAKPRIDVREIKAGNMPNLFGGTDWIINNIVKKSNADILDIEPRLTSVEIKDAAATLTGGP